MDIPKPQEFYLQRPIKIINAGLHNIVDLRPDNIRFIVVRNSFYAPPTEVAVFTNFNEAQIAADHWNRACGNDTDYTIERITLS